MKVKRDLELDGNTYLLTIEDFNSGLLGRVYENGLERRQLESTTDGIDGLKVSLLNAAYLLCAKEFDQSSGVGTWKLP